ncbi:MAG TPA: class I SAM-dependent methyltransferase [Streptosporangiaceae bacterium]|nr:class I SAM-dependent methyltransferase [Streptosporangiaceae bacterium]
MSDERPAGPGQDGAARTSGGYGTGPGVITPDGCAVDFYAMLSSGREPEIVHAAAGDPAASILELGSGTGRVTGALTALGHRVVAVDESAEMLAHITTAETVCARIEDLALDERFDVVLLASHLINVPDERDRQELLRACARHVSAAGCVVIEMHAPEWFAGAEETESESNGITFRLRGVSRPAPDLLSATVEYQVGDRLWTQSFTALKLGEGQLRRTLIDAGLAFDRYLTDDHSWLRAVPI